MQRLAFAGASGRTRSSGLLITNPFLLIFHNSARHSATVLVACCGQVLSCVRRLSARTVPKVSVRWRAAPTPHPRYRANFAVEALVFAGRRVYTTSGNPEPGSCFFSQARRRLEEELRAQRSRPHRKHLHPVQPGSRVRASARHLSDGAALNVRTLTQRRCILRSRGNRNASWNEASFR